MAVGVDWRVNSLSKGPEVEQGLLVLLKPPAPQELADVVPSGAGKKGRMAIQSARSSEASFRIPSRPSEASCIYLPGRKSHRAFPPMPRSLRRRCRSVTASVSDADSLVIIVRRSGVPRIELGFDVILLERKYLKRILARRNFDSGMLRTTSCVSRLVSRTLSFSAARAAEQPTKKEVEALFAENPQERRGNAYSMNRVEIVGGVANDPVFKTAKNDRPYTILNVITNSRLRLASGEFRDQSERHTITAFGRTAEFVAKNIKKAFDAYETSLFATFSSCQGLDILKYLYGCVLSIFEEWLPEFYVDMANL
ncbi:single-strand binding family protein [Ancylostoma ceylanicum]|uniref:Single-strand binding family protein n=1 Tax=Ancylostoma ceylanicum TaxID=53326 RepID=A0A0D6LVX6_9BILA|nr:single-strand binding family protein [Ancylostoma ceylanicum]